MTVKVELEGGAGFRTVLLTISQEADVLADELALPMVGALLLEVASIAAPVALHRHVGVTSHLRARNRMGTGDVHREKSPSGNGSTEGLQGDRERRRC